MANDYTTMKELRNTTTIARGSESDRYQKRGGSVTNKVGYVEGEEQRSIRAEQDYRKKDAVRHIVTEQGSDNPRLMRLLRNMESVRKGKPLVKS